MAFDVEGARAAGYTDAEIIGHLSKGKTFDVAGAKKAGYTDGEIISYLSKPAAPVRGSEQIPGYVPPAAPAPAPGLIDRAIGIGEAGLAGVSGTVGYLAGLAAGGNETVKALLYGATGTKPAPGMMPDPSGAFARESQALTYVPRTQAGIEATQGLAEIAGGLAPLAGLQGEAAVLSSAAGQAARTAAPLATATAQRTVTEVPEALKTASSAARQRINQTFGLADDVARTDGGSVGAAGVERARRLTETAEQLPVPVKLTKGESTGDAAQIRFEQEQAKGALGAPLREQSAATNKALGQNIEALIDRTGAETGSNIETGRVVTDQLTKAAAAEKARYRSLYNQADKAGEMSDPVDLQAVANYLNENRAGRTSAPIMQVIADQLKVQGVGGGSIADGSLSVGAMNIRQAEQLRKAVNRFVKDTDPNDVRVASDLRRIIDDSTEGAGGATYAEARKARQRYAQLFENNAVVSDLLRNRRGTADRQVALENVFNRTILNGSREDLGMLRRTLDISDQRQGMAPGTTGAGAQAWKELQGSTLRHILEEAQKGFGVDQAGGVRFSGAQLNKVLRDLDRGGKLDFVLGKKTAQTLRDLNEISRAVQSFPAGAVNSSNTASVVLAAIAEAGATGAMTGLPLPALSILRAGSQAIKDNKTRARIQASLNYKPGAK